MHRPRSQTWNQGGGYTLWLRGSLQSEGERRRSPFKPFYLANLTKPFPQSLPSAPASSRKLHLSCRSTEPSHPHLASGRAVLWTNKVWVIVVLTQCPKFVVKVIIYILPLQLIIWKMGLVILFIAAEEYGNKFITACKTAGYTNDEHERNSHKETNNSVLQQVCTMWNE